MKHKIVIRKDIKLPPTESEIQAMKQWGQDIEQKCLDCGKPTYYFNQCDDCNQNMIAQAKVMY